MINNSTEIKKIYKENEEENNQEILNIDEIGWNNLNWLK